MIGGIGGGPQSQTGGSGELTISWLKSINASLNTLSTIFANGASAALYPINATPLANSSLNASDDEAVATLTPAPGQRAYIEGFDITAGGAAAASIQPVAVSDSIGLLLVYEFTVVEGVTLGCPILSIRFPRPVPATAINLPITVTLPALGDGNTNAAISAYGFSV